MEGEHEIAGLRFWAGDPTVQVLDADDDLGAMLLERCKPGTALRELPETEQDAVLALLLRLMALAVSPSPLPPARGNDCVLEQRDLSASRALDRCRAGLGGFAAL